MWRELEPLASACGSLDDRIAISKARETLTRSRPALLSRTGATLDRGDVRSGEDSHDFTCDVSVRPVVQAAPVQAIES
jgi:hypothetical protein